MTFPGSAMPLRDKILTAWAGRLNLYDPVIHAVL